jgi:hypothetical protein
MEQGYDNASRWFVGVMESHLDVSEYIRKLHVAKTD